MSYMRCCRKKSYVEKKPSKTSYCVFKPIYSDLCKCAFKLVVIISYACLLDDSCIYLLSICSTWLNVCSQYFSQTIQILIVNSFWEKMIGNKNFKLFSEINYLFSISLLIPQNKSGLTKDRVTHSRRSKTFDIFTFIPIVTRKSFSCITKVLLVLHPFCSCYKIQTLWYMLKTSLLLGWKFHTDLWVFLEMGCSFL